MIYEKLKDKTDEELLEIMNTNSTGSDYFERAKVLLEMRAGKWMGESAARMGCCSRRIEIATWVILFATLAMLGVAFYR